MQTVSTWKPDLGSLEQLSQLLNQSSMADNKTQQEIYHKIEELTKNPEFYNYLVCIVAINDNPNITQLRYIAALTLKSTLQRNFENIPEENLTYVKSQLLNTFNDPQLLIRRAVALVVTAIVFRTGFQDWPEVLALMTNNLDSQDVGIVANTVDCFSKIVEEFHMNSNSYDFLLSEKMGQPLNQLLPKLLLMCDPKLPAEIRTAAFLTLNHFVYAMPTAFLPMIQTYVSLLYDGCKDADPVVRQKSCQGIVALLETRKDLILPHLDKIVERMAERSGDPEYEVARNAVLFFEEFLEKDSNESMERIYCLRKHFDRLLPCLLEGLKYTDLDRANQDEGESSEQKTEGLNLIGKEEEKDTVFQESNEEKTNFFDKGMNTLRKICGQTFERLAAIFKDEIFEKLQDKLVFCLSSTDWKIKEIGIVCIGALSNGCRESIEKHLKDLIPYFTQNLESNNKLIRGNALWTLSRFTDWLLSQSTTQPQILQDYIKLILKLVLDPERFVQESACTSFAILVSKDKGSLESYLLDIFQFLKPIFALYSGRSLKVLYDTVGLIAEKLPNKIKEPQIQEVLLPLVIEKWKITTSEDNTLIALFECVTSILKALGADAKPYLEIFAAKDIQMIAEYFDYIRNKGTKQEDQKRELCIRAIDMLMTILSILQRDFELILKNSKLLDLIGECLQSEDQEVKKFSFTFVGQLCMSCPVAFTGKAEVVLQVLAKNLVLVPTGQDAGNYFLILCNNATWAISELINAHPTEIAGYFGELALKFAELLLSKGLNRTLAYNLSTAIGRIAVYQPKVVAPYLPKITKHWSVAMTNTMNDLPKLQAFKGFFLAINENPEGIVQDFPFLCKALVMFKHNDEELEQASRTLINNFKKLSGNDWPTYFQKFPKDLQAELITRFGI